MRALLLIVAGTVAGAGMYEALFVARGVDRLVPFLFAVLYPLVAVLWLRRELGEEDSGKGIRSLPTAYGREYLRYHFQRRSIWFALATRGWSREPLPDPDNRSRV